MKKRVTMRFQMFITLMALFLAPTFLFCFFGYEWARSNIVQNANASYHATLENVAARIERDVANRENIVTLFNKTLMLRKLTYMQGASVDYTRVSVDDLHEYKTQLMFHCTGSPLFDEIAVCFPTKNLVISSLGLWKLDWFLLDEFSVQGVTQAQWQELFRTGGMLSGREISSFGYVKRGVVWAQPGVVDEAGNALMAVLFFAGNDTLRGYLDDLALYPGTITALFNEEGALMHALPGDAQQALLAAHAKTPQADEIRLADGARYEVIRTRSEPSGLTLCAFLPRGALYGEVHSITFVMALILFAMLAVGFVLSWELAAINYRPLERIFAALGAHKGHGAPTRQDVEGIEQQLLEILREQGALRRRMEESRDMLQYAALAHLLDGDASFGALSQGPALDLLDLPMPYDRFAVAVLAQARNPSGEGARLSALQEGHAVKFYPLVRTRQHVVVCNWQGEAQDGYVYHALQSLCGCVCLSQVYEGPEKLSQAMREAQEAADVRPLGAPICFYQKDQPMQPLYYPPETEKALLCALREGNEAQAIALFMELLQRNDRADTRAKLLVAVEWTVLKTDDGKGFLVRGLQSQQAQGPMEARVRCIRMLLGEAAGYHRRRIEEQRSAFAEEMLAYIDEHITDEQLSLTVLSDHLHVTATYLRRYFKEQMHTGYLDYVNKKRILLAKRMLEEGRLGVGEIAVQVGFGNDATFRRVFKKYEGTPPSRVQAASEAEKG